jgi:hypothetical protein
VSVIETPATGLLISSARTKKQDPQQAAGPVHFRFKPFETALGEYNVSPGDIACEGD